MAIPDYVSALIYDEANGYRWNYGSAVGSAVSLTYSFMEGVPSYYDSSASERNGFAAFSSDMQSMAREVLSEYAEVANLTFTEVSDSGAGGTIRFATASLGSGEGGHGYTPSLYYETGGDIWINNYFTNEYSDGKYGEFILLHELGHALGFKHSGNTGAGDPTPYLEAAYEDNSFTVMSYNMHPYNLVVNVTNSSAPFTSTAFYLYPGTPMLYDIAAIQYLYGANTSTRSGDDTYTFDPAAKSFRALWDGGGTDVVDLSNFSRSSSLFLEPGKLSSIGYWDPIEAQWPSGYTNTWTATTEVYDGTANFAVAYGANIENAKGGSANDLIEGNTLSNQLWGNGGDDQISGSSGGDELWGGAGNDTLTGGANDDSIDGGDGVDTSVWSAAASSYTFTAYQELGYEVHAKDASEHDFVYKNVEQLQFSDRFGDLNDFVTGQNAIYRFYNAGNGAHFYTASEVERDSIKATLANFQYEGQAFAGAMSGQTTNVYRFYNSATGTHFYTASSAERDSIQASLPNYKYEGAAYEAYEAATAVADGSLTALYRFYNSANGTHFFTASLAERDNVIATLPSYHYEGAAFWIYG